MNTLVLRSNLSGTLTFRNVLLKAREISLNAYAHQDIPFEKLVEELQSTRDQSRTPLFQVMLVLHDAEQEALSLPGLTTEPFPQKHNTSKFDLTLYLAKSQGGLLRGYWEYATDLFDATTIERLSRHFEVLLEGIVANPDQRIGELPLLTEQEQHQILVAWNSTTTALPNGKCVHKLFEDQVERTPDAIALVYEDQQVSYRELEKKSNELSHRLSTVGIRRGAVVGIYMARSVDLIVSILATLKAGAAYAPLDVNSPKDRLSLMLTDSGIRFVVTDSQFSKELRDIDRVMVILIDDGPGLPQPSHRLNSAVSLADPIYVIYTSGSTGVPKGSMALHRGFSNLVHWYIDELAISDIDRSLVFSSHGFDLTQKNLFAVLMRGGTLCLSSEVYDPTRISDEITKYEITLINCTPSAYYPLVEEARAFAGQLRYVILAGEPIDRSCLGPEYVKVMNYYGPLSAPTHVQPTTSRVQAAQFLLDAPLRTCRYMCCLPIFNLFP